MSSKERVLEGIQTVVAEHLDVHEPLPLEARLLEDLELDSIRLMTLAAEVENHFRVILEPEDEERIKTVSDLVDIVASKLESAS